MKTKRRLAGVLGVLMALCLVGSLATPALAQPPPMDHQFYGEVTSEGELVDDGASVVAKVNSVPCGSTTVALDVDGYNYNFDVDGGVASPGDPIEFYVDDVRAELYDAADEYLGTSYSFGSDEFRTELNLKVDITAPPVPDATKMTVTQNPPGTADSVEGTAGAVEASATVEVWDGEAAREELNLIGSAAATGDGSFSAIDIGDNLHDAVWITAKDAEDNRSDATEMANDIEAPAFVSVAVSDPDEFYKAGDTICFDVDLGEEGLTVTADLTVLDSALASDFALADDEDGTYSGTTSALSETMVEGVDTAVTLTATDAAGNPTTDDSLTLTIDKTPPVISETSPATDADIKAGFTLGYELDEDVASGTIVFTATEPAGTTQTYALGSGDFASGAHTIAEANLTDVTLVDGTVYSIDFDATDLAGNPASTVTNTGITYDTGAPTVTIDSIATSPTSTSPILMTATFSEDVTGFEVGDITVGNGTAGSFAGSGADYNFNVTATGEVVVTVDIAADVAEDTADNGNEAAPTFTINFDDVAPTVTIDSSASEPTNTSPIPMTATFSEGVTGFEVGDITVVNGAADNFAGSGTEYTFDVTPADQGEVTVDITAGVAEDAATNPNEAATKFSITYDSLAPTVTIEPATTPTNVDTLTLTGTMEEGATVVLTSVEATCGDVSYDTTTWSCQVTLVEDSNVITATATDAAGNTATDEATIVYDTAAPTATLSPVDTATDVAIDAVVTATFGEDVLEGALGDITITTDTTEVTGVSATLDANIITITHDDFALDTSYTVTIPAEAVEDLAGNLNAGISWSFTTETITYDLTMAVTGSGTTDPAVGDHSYAEGTVVDISATADAGWSFDSWIGDVADTSSPSTTVTMDATKTVTATFTQDQYTLTINTVGSGTVDQVPTPPYYQGDNTVVTLTANPAAGWSFSAWSVDLIGTVSPADITMDGDKMVTATFVELSDAAELLTYSIAGQVGDAVINSEDGTIAVVMPYGTDVTALVATFTASPDFQSIKVDEVDQTSGETANDFTDPVTYVVTGQDGTTKEFVVTVLEEEPTDADKVAADKAALDADAIRGDNPDIDNVTTNLTLITEGAVYSSVITWASSDENVIATDGSVTRPAFGEGNAEVTLTATITQSEAEDTKEFVVTVLEEEPTYDLTMVAEPEIGGTVTDVTGASPYAEGAEVNIKAVAEAGYRFVNWTSDPVGVFGAASEEETTFTMPGEAATVTANFELITYYTLDVTCNPTEGGSVTLNPSQPEGGYEAGTTVELTATANEDYAFGNWSGDLSGSTNPNTITTDSAKSIVANFVEFSAPENVSVTEIDPGVDSINVSTKDLGELDVPARIDPQEAYVVEPTGEGSFTLVFTDVPNASDIRVYKVVDGTWTRLEVTAVDATTIEVTMDCADPVLVFALPPATISTIDLLTGWNLLSTPIKLDADSDALEQILGESVTNIEASYRWDAQNWQWEVPTSYELSPLEAVYLKVKSDASATAEFIPSGEVSEPPSRELQAGLNLIGPAPALGEVVFPAMPLDQALISIAGAGGGLTGYTMVVSPGHNQTPWAYALGMEVKDLVPYKGYWVVMENASTLFGFSTTPIPE